MMSRLWSYCVGWFIAVLTHYKYDSGKSTSRGLFRVEPFNCTHARFPNILASTGGIQFYRLFATFHSKTSKRRKKSNVSLLSECLALQILFLRWQNQHFRLRVSRTATSIHWFANIAYVVQKSWRDIRFLVKLNFWRFFSFNSTALTRLEASAQVTQA